MPAATARAVQMAGTGTRRAGAAARAHRAAEDSTRAAAGRPCPAGCRSQAVLGTSPCTPGCSGPAREEDARMRADTAVAMRAVMGGLARLPLPVHARRTAVVARACAAATVEAARQHEERHGAVTLPHTARAVAGMCDVLINVWPVAWACAPRGTRTAARESPPRRRRPAASAREAEARTQRSGARTSSPASRRATTPSAHAPKL